MKSRSSTIESKDGRRFQPRLPNRSDTLRPHTEVQVAHHEATTNPPLPQSRDELLTLHRETRRRRNQAAHGSADHVAAIDLLAKIEVEVARIERAMDPPLG